MFQLALKLQTSRRLAGLWVVHTQVTQALSDEGRTVDGANGWTKERVLELLNCKMYLDGVLGVLLSIEIFNPNVKEYLDVLGVPCVA